MVRTIVAVILAAAALSAVWYVTRMPRFTIAAITVSGGTTIDHDRVEAEARSALSGAYLLLVPKSFALTYPRKTLTERIRKLSRVAKATALRTSLTALSITVTEYVPHALWCADASLSETDNRCFYITDAGYAFAEAPSLHGATFLRYVTEGRTPEVGASLGDASYVNMTKKFADALMEGHGMYVHTIAETEDGDVRYRVRGGGELLVRRDADIEKVFENLDAILTSREFKHAQSGDFGYIDLRFGDKVFVKESQSETVSEVSASSTEATTTETPHP
jgi:hypothetical protein